MTNDEKVQYTKQWGQRLELGLALQAGLTHSYKAALELLTMAKPGGDGYPSIVLEQAGWLMHLMDNINRTLQPMQATIEAAREMADPEYWRKREVRREQAEMTKGQFAGLNSVMREGPYTLSRTADASETPVADFLNRR